MLTTHVKYQIKINGHSILAEGGYSKFNDRHRAYYAFELPTGEQIYGLEQAREHATEYYQTQDQYTESRQKDVLTIEKVITLVDTVETFRRQF